MANYSIPNSTPAIGRISTPLSRRSRKQNNSVARCGPLSLRAVAGSGAPRPPSAQRPTPSAQRSIQTPESWMLDRLLAKAFGVKGWAFSFYWRVKGAWWSSRSSKPLSVPHTRDRGRFDSYPLRLSRLRIAECHYTTQELKNRTFEFGVRVISAVGALPKTETARILGRKLLRAGTSVGANYRAAARARSQADFISKLGVVEEECDESAYWMEVIIARKLLRRAQLKSLLAEANELLAITVASIKTARRRPRA
jgi:four helix bundle protein